MVVFKFILIILGLLLRIVGCDEPPDDGKETEYHVCGNGIVEPEDGEDCEPGDEPSCALFGMGGGNATCSETCEWDLSECTELEDHTLDPTAITTARFLSSGERASCVWGEGIARPLCWGAEHAGLAPGMSDDHSLKELPVPSGEIVALALGDSNGCAIVKSGEVKCWGTFYPPDAGIMGEYWEEPRTVMTVTMDGTVQPSIAMGASHACVLDAHGTVWCWGQNDYMECGVEGKEYVDTPTRVFSGATAIALASTASCALDEKGSVWCWGALGRGIVATAGPETSAQPEPVLTKDGSPLEGIVSFGVDDTFGCGALSNGSVWCWGVWPILLAPDWDEPATPPHELTSPDGLEFDDVVQVVAGSGRACALRREGTVLCWGENYENVLGLGLGVSDDPVTDPGYVLQEDGRRLSGVVSLSAGSGFSCAVKGDGSVWCWGRNSLHQADWDDDEDVVPLARRVIE